MTKEEIQALQKYLKLEKEDDAEKVAWILDELKNYGEWGDKVSVYLTSILSGTDGENLFLPKNQVEAFKSLFQEIKIKEE